MSTLDHEVLPSCWIISVVNPFLAKSASSKSITLKTSYSFNKPGEAIFERDRKRGIGVESIALLVFVLEYIHLYLGIFIKGVSLSCNTPIKMIKLKISNDIKIIAALLSKQKLLNAPEYEKREKYE